MMAPHVLECIFCAANNAMLGLNCVRYRYDIRYDIMAGRVSVCDTCLFTNITALAV
jgi:hypothetical protein